MRRLTRIVISAIAAVMLMAGPASAAGGWVPQPGTTVENGVITLDTRDEAGTPLGTSLEHSDLGTDLGGGDVISFEYRILDEAVCGGGQPRVFVEIDGTYFNTFDGNPNQCGTGEDSDGWSTVTYVLPEGVDGRVGHAGVVFDNPSDRGVAQVRNVVIGGDSIFPSSKDACKKGGWMDAGYRNQGECVSTFASGK